jgi:hypothetical protein
VEQLPLGFNTKLGARGAGLGGGRHLNAAIAKNVKSLKTFLNWATKLSYNKTLIYKNFIVKDRAPEIITLTESEFWKINDLNLKYSSLCLCNGSTNPYEGFCM